MCCIGISDLHPTNCDDRKREIRYRLSNLCCCKESKSEIYVESDVPMVGQVTKDRREYSQPLRFPLKDAPSPCAVPIHHKVSTSVFPSEDVLLRKLTCYFQQHLRSDR